MFARLTSLNEHPSIALADVLTVIGRQENCNVRIFSSRVSRRHCCLIRDRDEVVVFDLRSSNGIRINGCRVEDGLLRHGDVLEIAHLRYKLEIVAADELESTTTRDDQKSGQVDGRAASVPMLREDELRETNDDDWRPILEG